MRPSIKYIAGFYLAMGLVGAALAAWRKDKWQFDPFAFPGDHIAAAAAISLATCAFIIFGSAILLRISARMQRCAGQLQQIFGHLKDREILVLAIFSSLGEELLFRGWLLNESGLLISSIIFGLAHFPLNRDWMWWPAFAVGFGLLAGALCLWTNTLLWAVLIHAAVNFFNIRKSLRTQVPSHASTLQPPPPA